jgi:DNA-binding NtrC family response regulator
MPGGQAAEPAGQGFAIMLAQPTHVLLVEDEFLITDLMTEVLGDRGFAVHAVAAAEDALRYIDEGATVDVLFTDINLPGGMDGSLLAEEVRQRRPELPIVYCSGRYPVSALMPLVPRSVFVQKPYDPADLCTLLERLTQTTH